MAKKLKFFLIPCDFSKRPLLSNGEYGASNDPDVVRGWKERWPDCNLAIATGPSGLIAIDLDKYKDNYDAVKTSLALFANDGTTTVCWKTARGGTVEIYKRPPGLEVPSKIALLPAVDVKASTGYVLMPGSRNEAGQTYEWINSPVNTEVAEAPQKLVDFILNHKPKASALPKAEGRDEVFLSAGDGRWEHLRRLGGMMRRMGCGYDTLVDALKAFVEFQCEYDDTLRHAEIERLAAWLSSIPYDNASVDDKKEKE